MGGYLPTKLRKKYCYEKSHVCIGNCCSWDRTIFFILSEGWVLRVFSFPCVSFFQVFKFVRYQYRFLSGNWLLLCCDVSSEYV